MKAYHVLEARQVSGHIVWLRFRDGTTGAVDLTSVPRGPVFELLQDVEYFRRFQIHPAFRTLVWPNGADVAPEYLQQQARVAA